MGTNPNWAPGPAYPVPPYMQPQPQPSAQAPDERLERFWYVKAPAWLDDWFPQIAKAMSDGAWLAAWRGVGASAPVIGFALGLLCRFIFPQIQSGYSDSLVFMMVVIAVSLLSGTMGAAMLGGYVVQDLIAGNQAAIYGRPAFTGSGAAGTPLGIAGLLGGKLVSYLLLSIPAITLPLLVRQLAPSIKLSSITDPNSRLLALAGLHAAIAGVLVFLWAQSMIVLLRPLFTWVGADPSTAAIAPVQTQWNFLVGAGAVAAAVRVLVERKLSATSRRAIVAYSLQRLRFTGEGQGILEKVPGIVRTAVPPVVITMTLAGTYDGWQDAVIVALMVAVLGLWRSRLIRLIPLPSQWSLTIRRIPALIRLAVAPFIGYWLSSIVLTPMWSTTNGLRPVMFGSLLTLLVFYVLFPPLPVVRGTAPQTQPTR
ncbi:MAG TPA: hypothetical protein VGE04_09055 [Chloroflexia bacterium]